MLPAVEVLPVCPAVKVPVHSAAAAMAVGLALSSVAVVGTLADSIACNC